tara:strand:+ start:1583 stop:1855 length:273 start_codon:yes stop_codon:yes gene_type:complete
MTWKQIADGKSFPFIIVWKNINQPNKVLRAGVLKAEGKIGEKVTWRIHYLDSSEPYEIPKMLWSKDFKGKESRDKVLSFAKSWMKKHPNG